MPPITVYTLPGLGFHTGHCSLRLHSLVVQPTPAGGKAKHEGACPCCSDQSPDYHSLFFPSPPPLSPLLTSGTYGKSNSLSSSYKVVDTQACASQMLICMNQPGILLKCRCGFSRSEEVPEGQHFQPAPWCCWCCQHGATF